MPTNYYESAFMLHHFSYLKASSPSNVFTGSAPPPTNYYGSAFMLHHSSYLKASSPSHVFTGSAPPPTNFYDSAFMLHHFFYLKASSPSHEPLPLVGITSLIEITINRTQILTIKVRVLAPPPIFSDTLTR